MAIAIKVTPTVVGPKGLAAAGGLRVDDGKHTCDDPVVTCCSWISGIAGDILQIHTIIRQEERQR
jgi:hypothetical protein